MAATPCTRLEPAARRAVLRTAAAAIEAGLGHDPAATPDASVGTPGLLEPRACFVTLLLGGELRGCCGSLEPRRPLLMDVWHNAQASAFRDPRFAPLTPPEWPGVHCEVSVLRPSERLAVASEADLLARLVPGRDGLVLAWRGVRATFLPKVWEQVDGPRDFLDRLRQKAGWPAGFWATDLEVWRYETEVIGPQRLAMPEA